MKKLSVLVILGILIFTTSQVQAGNNTSHTTSVGVVSGALVGQAIGRDTEATIVGAALGGAIGYIVGNEMDKNGDVRHERHITPTRVVHVQPHSRPVKVVVVNNNAGHWGRKVERWNHHNKRHHNKRYYYQKHHQKHRQNHREQHSRYSRW